MDLEPELSAAEEEEVTGSSFSSVDTVPAEVRQPTIQSMEPSTECQGVDPPIGAPTSSCNLRRSTRMRHPPTRLIDTM